MIDKLSGYLLFEFWLLLDCAEFLDPKQYFKPYGFGIIFIFNVNPFYE